MLFAIIHRIAMFTPLVCIAYSQHILYVFTETSVYQERIPKPCAARNDHLQRDSTIKSYCRQFPYGDKDCKPLRCYESEADVRIYVVSLRR